MRVEPRIRRTKSFTLRVSLFAGGEAMASLKDQSGVVVAERQGSGTPFVEALVAEAKRLGAVSIICRGNGADIALWACQHAGMPAVIRVNHKGRPRK